MMQKEGSGVNRQTSTIISLGLCMLSGGLLLSGCVVLEEKYNAEKARSLNFQRLLAQEEKRTAELDSEVKRTKKEMAEFEARNRELSAQVQAAREQMARLQEEAEAIKESALLERKALEDMRKMSAAPGKTKQPEPVADFAKDLEKTPVEGSKELPAVAAPPAAKAGSAIHVVKPGETLFSIGRRYKVEVEKLKKWNKLPDDIIEVGQKLVIGTE
jgi:LysM repeat protein